jgi:recombination protein RecA
MATEEEIAKELEAAFGASDDESTVSSFLDSGYPELNFALSSNWKNGFPVGRLIEIAGPPSSGKTAIATAAMAAAQKQGGFAGFMDHERSFSLKLAPRLGLNVAPSRFMFKKPRTFEESITLCIRVAQHIRTKKLIKPEAPICWVFDSLASMVPQSALIDPKTGKEKSAEDRNMNDNTALARATSAHLPAFMQHVEELGICAIFLNQVRTKIGVIYGDPRTTPGGEAPKFYASIRIMLGATKMTKKIAGANEAIGSEVTASVIKNKVTRPFMAAKWRFIFEPDGTGKFDRVGSTIDFLLKEKKLEVAGAYIVWKGTKYYAAALAARIEKEGEWEELLELLPKRYEPEIIVIEEGVTEIAPIIEEEIAA